MNINTLIKQYEEELDICGAAHYSCLLAKTEMLKILQKEQREWVKKYSMYLYTDKKMRPETKLIKAVSLKRLLIEFGLDN